MIFLIPVLLLGFAVFLMTILVKLLKKPMKWAFKLLIHAALGYVALFVFDFFGAFIDIQLGLNWVNAIVTGLLGVPGVILLLLLKYIF